VLPFHQYAKIYLFQETLAQEKFFFEILESTSTKEILFKNAQTWVAKSYGDYKSVLQFEEKDAGKLIIKGTSSIKSKYSSRIKYTLELDIKDKKYRVNLSDMQISFDSMDPLASFHSYDSHKLSETIISEYDARILLLEKSTAEKQSRKLTKELEKEKLDRTEYVKNAEIEIKSIRDAVTKTFASLKSSMNKSDDF
jgi:hypothetical protein